MVARSLRVLVGLVSLLVAFALSGASASALVTHPFLGEFGVAPETGFGNVLGLAVDESSGDVYVYDAAGGGTLFKFDANGKPAKFSGLAGEPSEIENVGTGAPTEDQVAVDNSSLSTKGDIYLAANDGVVKIFGPDGKALGAIEAESSTETVAKEANKEPVAPWGETLGVTVDGSGNVYVGIWSTSVNKYVPKGSIVSAKDYVSSVFTKAGVANVVVDSVGDVYVSEWNGGTVIRYEPSQFVARDEQIQFGHPPFGQGDVVAFGMAVAVDPKTDDVLVDQGSQIAQFGPRGEPFLSPLLAFANISGSDGIAVNGVDGVTYVSTGRGQVARYGPLVTLPDTTTGAATEVTANSAVLHGTVNPDGVPVTNCRFEYGRGTDYGQSVPCSPSPGEGSSPVQVSASVSLEPWVDYHFRLVAGNSSGDNPGADQRMFTEAAASPPAANDTCPNASVRLGGPSELLPDCRAYEMVSPLDKGGSFVGANGLKGARAGVDGEEAYFIMFAGVGDVAGSGGVGLTDYVASRGSSGWQTRSITPASPTTALQNIEGGTYPIGAFSSDLRHAIFYGYQLPGADPGTGVQNLYRLDTLTRGLETITLKNSPEPINCYNCLTLGKLGEGDGAVGYSSDLGVVTFESLVNLTPDASGTAPKLYEWDHGVLRLGGILPNGTVPAGGAVGPAESSRGGEESKSKFDAAPHAVSSDGSRVLFASPGPEPKQTQQSPVQQLYMRVKGKSTVWLSRSWISNPAPEYVYFQASSADDRKVLFSTRTRLLESDPGNGEIALYMYTYSESEPESEGKLEFVTRVNTDHPDNRREEEGIVAGMSEDGTHVYFYTGSSTLVLPKRGEYLWDKGTIHFVAGVNEPISWLTTNIGGKPEELRRGSLARVSADGRRLAFQWVADRVNEAELAAPAPNEDTGVAEPGVRHEIRGGLGSGYGYTEDAVSYRALYVYDEASEKLNCVSCPPNGSPMTASVEIDANAVENDLQGGVGVFMPRFFSSDGKRLFFTSHDALVPQDTNGRADVYEYDVDTKEAKLLSSGTGGNGAWFEDASENGDDVFFLTAEKLLRGDTDTLSDLYDARVSGGFSEPLPPPPPCDGDACQGVPSAVPSFSTASGFTGLGNQHSSTVTQKSKQKKAKPKRRKHGKPRRHAKGRHARVAGRGAHRSSRVGR